MYNAAVQRQKPRVRIMNQLAFQSAQYRMSPFVTQVIINEGVSESIQYGPITSATISCNRCSATLRVGIYRSSILPEDFTDRSACQGLSSFQREAQARELCSQRTSLTLYLIAQ